MIRKIVLMMVGVCLVSLIGIGIFTSLQKKSELQKVTGSLNLLTENALNIVGENPTLETIDNAQKHIEEQKGSIIERIQALKDSGILKPGSEAQIELNLVNEINREKFAEAYDKFVDKSYDDIEKLNKVTEKLIKLGNSPKSSKELKNVRQEAEKLAQENETNMALINGMDDLVNQYNSIIEN